MLRSLSENLFITAKIHHKYYFLLKTVIKCTKIHRLNSLLNPAKKNLHCLALFFKTNNSNVFSNRLFCFSYRSLSKRRCCFKRSFWYGVLGNLVVIIKLHFRFSLLTPCYFAGFISWSKKTVKKLYEKKTGKEDRRPRHLLYFSFISGFKNSSVAEEIIPESK